MAKARCKIRESVRDTAKKAAKKSIFWPIMIGVATMLIVGFLQFNRVLIGTVKAYISPNAGAEASMVEIDPTVTTAVGEETVLIIPKINVEVPIVLGVGSDNASQQEGMKHGVTHFAIPGANALPGELGNFVVSGHSSRRI